jgi:hypothetical protein
LIAFSWYSLSRVSFFSLYQLTPKWTNEECILNVHNATHTLRIDMFDKDPMNDDHMAYVEVPLSTFSHQVRVDAWYEMTLSEEAKNADKRGAAGAAGDAIKAVGSGAMKGVKTVANAIPTPLSSKRKAIAEASVEGKQDPSTAPPTSLPVSPRTAKIPPERRPMIRLEVQYTFSKVSRPLGFHNNPSLFFPLGVSWGAMSSGWRVLFALQPKEAGPCS